MKLSKRLQTVANHIPKGCAVADIGSDHAYLPVYLIENNIAQRAVAGEVNPGPFEAAKRTVAEHGLSDKIIVRKGDGLAVISAGEADVVTINGMGGGTIADILDNGADKLETVTRLVLQPMVDAEQLRRWLHANRWQIAAEDIVIDDGLLYEIIVAEPGKQIYKDPLWYEIGSIELIGNHPLFPDKVQAVVEKVNRVLKNLQKAKAEQADQKREQLLQKKKRLEEVLRFATEGR